MAFCLLVLTTVNVQKWVIYCARDTNNFFFRRCDELFASDGNNNIQGIEYPVFLLKIFPRGKDVLVYFHHHHYRLVLRLSSTKSQLSLLRRRPKSLRVPTRQRWHWLRLREWHSRLRAAAWRRSPLPRHWGWRRVAASRPWVSTVVVTPLDVCKVFLLLLFLFANPAETSETDMIVIAPGETFKTDAIALINIAFCSS